MNLFDYINKLIGKPTREEREDSASRVRWHKRQEEFRRNPSPVIQPKKFEPTPSDPEYYATRGATNEAEAQQMVNRHRESVSPGVKPVFPSVRVEPLSQPQQSVTVSRPNPIRLQSVSRLPVDDERHKISSSGW